MIILKCRIKENVELQKMYKCINKIQKCIKCRNKQLKYINVEL